MRQRVKDREYVRAGEDKQCGHLTQPRFLQHPSFISIIHGYTTVGTMRGSNFHQYYTDISCHLFLDLSSKIQLWNVSESKCLQCHRKFKRSKFKSIVQLHEHKLSTYIQLMLFYLEIKLCVFQKRGNLFPSVNLIKMP